MGTLLLPQSILYLGLFEKEPVVRSIYFMIHKEDKFYTILVKLMDTEKMFSYLGRVGCSPIYVKTHSIYDTYSIVNHLTTEGYEEIPSHEACSIWYEVLPFTSALSYREYIKEN